ncbi:DUF4837 family protein [candidate division WOR-3 bacterium]|nr:DUF4837 family protein [candidate division WOR-3 bacterium]
MKRMVLLVAAAALLAGCSKRQVPAVGPLREITVASDQWGAVESIVRATLQQRLPMPQPEVEFKLRVFGLGEYARYSLLRTLLMVGTSSDSVIRAVLGPRADSLPGGDWGMFQVPNAWARNQRLVVFVARDEDRLVPGLVAYGPRLRQTCREAVLDHSARAVYYRGLNNRAGDSLRERHSFGIDVPRSWWLRQDQSDSNFVYLYGHHPDRNVFVYWEDRERPLDPDALYRLRDSLGVRFYDGDITADTLRWHSTIEFLGGPCLRLAGIWENEESTIGGPFVSYAFNHEGRFYLLDGLVFNPGRDKLDGLFQAEAVMRTFAPR